MKTGDGDIVAFDGIYMNKMSAAGKKAWETRRKQKIIEEIVNKMDALINELKELIK